MKRALAVLGAGLVAGVGSSAHADHPPAPPPAFVLSTPPLGARPPAAPRRVSLDGGPLAAIEGGALIADWQSGDLVAVDAEGRETARLPVGRDVAQVVVDRTRARAYVADRRGDRIVVVDLRKGLRAQTSFPTRAEPYGLALTPDGELLLCAAIADRSLTAYEAASGRARWRLPLAPEPRGVAVSPDGKLAVVSFLTTGAVARVDLPGHTVSMVSLEPPLSALGEDGRPERPPVFARDAFAVTFTDGGTAIVPHQISVPDQPSFGEVDGSYGGGGPARGLPVAAREVAFIAFEPGAGERTAKGAIALAEPDALVYDAASDTLIFAGYASDDLVAVADASRPSIHFAWRRSLGPEGGRCGPSGVVVADGALVGYCDLARRAFRIEREVVQLGPVLGGARLTAQEERGRALFHQGGDGTLSAGGLLSCGGCHPDGRADGLTWRIDGHVLQTPMLAGRLVGTEPYKWNGLDESLPDSVRRTVVRLGGSGLDDGRVADLVAYLRAMERPRPRPPHDPVAVARGAALFTDGKVGCSGCHGGAQLSDGRQFSLGLLGRVDTPSLVGLGLSAPYYHDGSAATLRDLLLGNGSVHGMGRVDQLSSAQIDDLVAFLEAL